MALDAAPPPQPRVTRRRLLAAVCAGAAAGAVAAVGPRRSPVALARSEPTGAWERVLSDALGGSIGYCYAVARHGEMMAGGGVGLARSAAAHANAGAPWTLDTLCNLASVSKTVTATAIMTVVQQRGVGLLDDAVWPMLAASGRLGGPPGAGVAEVTVRHLLTHTSGLVPDGTLYLRDRTVDAFLDTYLRQDVVARPGTRFRYSNTNFTVLQVLLEVLTDGAPGSYTDAVHARVLTPAGVTAEHFTASPDPATVALHYSDRNDARPGHLWASMQCVGPGGWLASARGLLAYLTAIRSGAVLGPAMRDLMFEQRLGWYRGESATGSYLHHNGGLFSGGAPRRETHTGAVHFADGRDAVLLVNSGPSVRTIGLMARAMSQDP